MNLISNPYAISSEEVCQLLQADLQNGLSSAEVRKRRNEYGRNLLKKERPKPIIYILFDQILDPVIYILILATIVGFIFGEWMEGIAVAGVITITVILGFVMEYQALRSMEALSKLAQSTTNVWRNGKLITLQDHYLVPGDLIQLEVGDVVPADARVISHESLAVKEAILTGESGQVEKKVDSIPIKAPITDQTNMIFKGTLVTRGTVNAIVCYTGNHTELGKINLLSQQATKTRTPLEKKLAYLSRRLISLTIGLAFIIVIVGILQGKPLILMIETGIALAIAAIPEGLPIVATIALARGMLKLADKNVIIKKLEAVETLGETGIICTDKTGTLTENKMELNAIVLSDGEPLCFPQKVSQLISKKPALDILIKVGILCNNANEDQGGDPEEIALLDFARDSGYNVHQIRNEYQEVIEIPFDAETKLMATLNQKGKEYRISVKGAIENILVHSKFQLEEEETVPLEDKMFWLNAADQLARQGLRTMGIAYNKTNSEPSHETIFEDLIIVGVVGFLDPAREDIKDAIRTYHNAGIEVVMVTGDHPQTAHKIATDVELIPSDENSPDIVLGNDIKSIEKMDPNLKAKLMETKIFARVTPKQKLDLVTLYQKNGFTVGMTGDGVNDAPALKKADIGIAMGIRGTEAAQEVADVILKDDRFTSIELAIYQGRTIFHNIRQFVVYLMSCNLAEIISVALASISNLPLPLLPLQILFLNLVTDVFPALALGMGKGNPSVMLQPPRSPNEPILIARHWKNITLYGFSISAVVIGILVYAHFILELPNKLVNNLAFYTLLLAQLFNVFNLPHPRFSFFRNEVTKNPWVLGAILLSLAIIIIAFQVPFTREVLGLTTIGWSHIGMIFLFSAGSVVLVQILKRIAFQKIRNNYVKIKENKSRIL